MHKFFAAGPTSTGRYLVAYRTPGCSILTCVADCRTIDGACEESARLNREQVEREEAIRYERDLRGLRGVYPDLKRT